MLDRRGIAVGLLQFGKMAVHMTRRALEKRVVWIMAKCVGCGKRQEFLAGEVESYGPMCKSCGMPMIACAALAKRRKR